MMIILYDSKETNFNANGLVVLSDSTSCFTTERLNDLYEVDLEYPIDPRGKWQYIVEGNIIKNSNGQLFRIYHKEKSLTGIKATARHIFYDLLGNFVESVIINSQNVAGALGNLLGATQFSHNFTASGDIANLYTAALFAVNPVDGIMGDSGIMSIWGGELVRDNFNVGLVTQRGEDQGVLVSYGKNIVGVDEVLDMTNVVTRLYPIGKDGLLLSEKYVDSPYINNYPHPKIKSVQFSDISDQASLRAAAQNYFATTGCDLPAANYTVDFVDLSRTEEYKNYKILETVNLGDVVTIRHSRLGIDLKLRIVSIKFNDLYNKIDTIELGNLKVTLANSLNKALNSINTMSSNLSGISDGQGGLDSQALQTAIQNATNLIISGNNGHVIYDSNGISIMDTADKNTAQKVWRWNLNGLGYSSTGYNGPFALAMTSDGHIVADYIATGTFDAGKVNVENLTVGANVQMGPDATISWANVTGTPDPYTDAQALQAWVNSGYKTYITSTGVYTGTLTAQQINAINGIILGANASIAWTSVTGAPTIPTTAAQVGAEVAIAKQSTPPSNTSQLWLDTTTTPYILKKYNGSSWVNASPTNPADIDAVANDQLSVFNTLTNNGANPGLYMSNGQLYINADYIKSGAIDADLITAGKLNAARIGGTVITFDNGCSVDVSSGFFRARYDSNNYMSYENQVARFYFMGDSGNARCTIKPDGFYVDGVKVGTGGATAVFA